MCRSHFDKLFVPVVDKELQAQIAHDMGRQYEERKAELEAAGDWIGDKRLIRFAFGNTHEEVKNPKPSRSSKEHQNTHRWCMFMSLNNNPEETQKYIKSVTYHLHPTFRPSKIKVEEAPFLLSRLGWGYFEVVMDVEFQPSTGLGMHRLEHMLNFDDKGHTESILLEVDDSKNNKDLAVALAAKMKKMKIEEKKK